ncbi:MAG: sigma factor-like helix-turn-helix DNA-binding protein [Ruminococcus sp.]|nr:sigma factor-like helix-turn-helix DNA-binding protein [Ruminococcus sp.]
MSMKEIKITNKNINKIFFDKSVSDSYSKTNYKQKQNMKLLLSKAIENELTDNQKKCLIDYYLKGKKEKEIALEMGIAPCTVSRHITAGKKKLKRIASYFAA